MDLLLKACPTVAERRTARRASTVWNSFTWESKQSPAGRRGGSGSAKGFVCHTPDAADCPSSCQFCPLIDCVLRSSSSRDFSMCLKASRRLSGGAGCAASGSAASKILAGSTSPDCSAISSSLMSGEFSSKRSSPAACRSRR